MERLIHSRIRMFAVACILVVCVFSLRLFKLQSRGASSAADGNQSNSISYASTVAAARGNLLDRNGVVLVANRASYDLKIVNYILLGMGKPNEKLATLVEKCDEMGVEITDHLPISDQKPYSYEKDNYSDAWLDYFDTYLAFRNWDPEISAKNLMRNMKQVYSIPADWNEPLVRKVAGLRFELDLRYCTTLETYTLAADVDAKALAAITELGLSGVTVETSTVRDVRTEYAAHILGRVGLMDGDEWARYRDEGYSMDARVGKEGLEQIFESYLHGTPGRKVTTLSADGKRLGERYDTVPIAGENVELSIDIRLQAAAEKSLAETILDLRKNGVGAKKEGKDAEGGAVVAIECKTGEVLACASYPTFRLSTYSEDFKKNQATKYDPLYNRTLQAAYYPGSIYKMVTAIAAIDGGGIGRYREITDKGVYTYYAKEGYTCNCYLYTSQGITHGTINMMEALSESCNYYFYEVGRLTGIQKIDEVAKGLGLGESTGIELMETTGSRANPDTKALLYQNTDSSGWYGADTLQAAIGQSDNKFSPMQMACYTAALANGGTRYKASFLHRVVSRDFSELLGVHTPEIALQFTLSDQAKACVSEGMRLAAKEGTAATWFRDYPVPVAAKTGTAQHGGEGSDHASFVCYAPVDDPEIAVAVYVEKGAQGGNLGQVAVAVLDAYFEGGSAYEVTATENTPG